MEASSPATPFEMTGSFGGFVYTEAGKRRLVLQAEGHDCLLKVPRILRRRMIGKFRLGETIRVAGTEARDPATGLLRRMVAQVLPGAAETASPFVSTAPAPPRPVAVCPIRVCAKKNCWRAGGHDLWRALQHELGARDLTARVELRQVGCLDRCKRAPNVDWDDHEYTHCAASDAAAIIDRAMGNALPRPADTG